MIRLALALSIAACAAVVDPGYRTEIETWRQKREERLRSEHGWLAVSGLFWLKPGRNVLPAPFDKAGWFDFKDGKAVAHIGAKALELKGDDDATDVDFGRYIFELHASGERRGIRVWDRDNPRRKSLSRLNWYPVDEAYRVNGRFIPYDRPKEIVVQNISGDSEKTSISGEVEFELRGRKLHLISLEESSKLFFVFRDRTSGKQTYTTARFLGADPPKDGVVVLDFNRAYNPPCAFTSFVSCPLPPPGNHLDVAIEAGEKLPSGGH